MNILVTGKSSFLFQKLLESGIFNDDNLYEYEYGVTYTNIDRIFHFGSPSCKEDFKDRATMAVSMIDYTVAIAEIAIANKADVIYASSEGVYDVDEIDVAFEVNDQGRYNLFKLVNEEYLLSFKDIFKTCVLRIPRVYGMERNIGLVGKLIAGDVDENELDNKVTFIDAPRFVKFTIDSLKEFAEFGYFVYGIPDDEKTTCALHDVLGHLS